jgi:hypothetical protein
MPASSVTRRPLLLESESWGICGPRDDQSSGALPVPLSKPPLETSVAVAIVARTATAPTAAADLMTRRTAADDRVRNDMTGPPSRTAGHS